MNNYPDFLIYIGSSFKGGGLSASVSRNYMKAFYLILLIGVISYEQSNSQNVKLGNSSGNILNNGLIASDNKRIYYSSLDSTYGLYSMKPDGTDIKLLTGDYTKFINVLNGWLYYRKGSSDSKPQIGGLYKMRTDGTQEQRLTSGSPFYINVVDDWIYFIDDAAGGIWKIKTDGSNIQRLYVGNYDCLTTDGKSLYFAWYSDSVFKATFDGQHISKILTGHIEHPFISGDWLYYKTDYYKICRINKETLGIETLVADKNLGADYIILKNQDLYFGGVFGIKKYNLQKKTWQNMYDVRIIELGLAADYIYFTTAIWDKNNERHTKANLIQLKELKLVSH
jgi:hypothetical protein